MTRLEILQAAKALLESGRTRFICHAIQIAQGLPTDNNSDPEIMQSLVGNGTLFGWLYDQLEPIYGSEATISLANTYVHQARLAWLDRLIADAQC